MWSLLNLKKLKMRNFDLKKIAEDLIETFKLLPITEWSTSTIASAIFFFSLGE